jgi:hypothetical protein
MPANMRVSMAWLARKVLRTEYLARRSAPPKRVAEGSETSTLVTRAGDN